MHWGWALIAMGLAVLVSPAVRADELTLEEAVRVAVQRSHEVRMSDLEREKALDLKMGALGQMGPKLGVSGKLLHWDRATEVSFGFEIPEAIKQLGIEIPSSMHVMDQTTGDLSFTVAQPLTPLLSLYSLYRIQGDAERAAEAARQAKARGVAYQVAEAFFGLLKLRKARETALQARAQVETHLKTATAFFEQGYVQKDDVLRAQVALAKVHEGIEQVATAIEVTTASLNLMLGRQTSQDITPVYACEDPPPPLDVTLEEALDRAYARRSEIREVSHRLEMARAGRLAAIGAMLPTLAAAFNWTRQWGSEFQRKTSYFIGGTLQWNFWEWGAQYHQVRAAERDIARLIEAQAAIRDLVTLDVKRAYLQARLALTTIETARKAVSLAEESHRIATNKYAVHLATSMEVLDAESALTNARNSYYDALYSYYLALENLKRATGEREVAL